MIFSSPFPPRIVSLQESWCCTLKAMELSHFHPILPQNHMPAPVWCQVRITRAWVGLEALLFMAFSLTRPYDQGQLCPQGAVSAGPAAAANGVLARFLCACGFFGAMLHQFLPAETIQAS